MFELEQLIRDSSNGVVAQVQSAEMLELEQFIRDSSNGVVAQVAE